MEPHKNDATDHVSPSHSHEEKGNVVRPGQQKKRGCAAHCKRFWWLYLIIIAIVILVVVLPVIFVAIPKIAQNNVNDSTLEIESQQVLRPTSGKVDLDIASVTRSDSKYHPELDEFEADLFLESTRPDIKPFGRLTFPAVKVAAENRVQVAQTMEIIDMDQFIEYNKLVVDSEEFSFGVKGRTGLKLGSLPKYTVDYDKTVTMKGLNKLNGFEIRSFEIVRPALPDGSNLRGTAFIPNPSVFTIEMGKVVLNLSVDGTYLGNSTIQSLTLRPGDNIFNMTSIVSQGAVLQLITSKYKDGILPIDIIGNSTKNGDGETLPYFEAAVKQNSLRANLDVGAALAKIGLNVTSQ